MAQVPDFKFTRKAPGVDVFISGHQNLIFRLRRADVWMKEQVYITQERIGKRLQRDARLLWSPHNKSGTVHRNIAYEQKELARTYRLSFGLSNARATRGSKAIGSKAFAGGAEGTEGEAAHGIWIDKGTGIFGLHRRPYPGTRGRGQGVSDPARLAMLRASYQRRSWNQGTRRTGNKGIVPRPFITASYAKNRPWIDQQYRDLGRKLKIYVDTGAPPS